MTALATLGHVTFRYPDAREAALRDVSLEVEPGELLLLCGATGSGKSTLLRLLMGIVPQLSGGELDGAVTVLGADVTRELPHVLAGRGVTLVSQDPAESFVAERVEAEVAFGPENLALSPDDVDARVREALRAVGLSEAAGRRVRELSGGEQQRVAIAAALAMRPRLLLLDEPTAHVDEPTARTVLALVAQVVRERGIGCVLADHRLAIAAPLASRAVVLDAGAIRAAGPPREVFGDPAMVRLGVPVPRSTQAAVALGIRPPLPLAPEELVSRIRSAHGAPVPDGDDVAPAARPGGTSRQGSSEPALRFEGVRFRYPGAPSDAVHDITFSVERGERVGLVGPTGSGKSTIARLAVGLRRPAGGRVWLCGMPTDVTAVRRLADAGGLVLQDPLRQLLTERVEDELRLGLRELGDAEAERRVDEALGRFGLTALRRRHPLTLSEGERRRLTIAAALVRRPAVLLLDEPTLGQDDRQRSELVRVVHEAAAAGSAVCVIGHDPEFVNDSCERVLAIRAGCIEADLTLADDASGAERLVAAGVPLAEAPATVLLLSRAGVEVRARTLPQLVDALARVAVRG